MTKTSADVAALALEFIGVKPLAQEANATHAAKAAQAYSDLLEELSEDGAAIEWTADETPLKFFRPLAGMVAARISAQFGKQFDAERAEAAFRRLMYRDDRNPSAATPADYY